MIKKVIVAFGVISTAFGFAPDSPLFLQPPLSKLPCSMLSEGVHRFKFQRLSPFSKQAADHPQHLSRRSELFQTAGSFSEVEPKVPYGFHFKVGKSKKIVTLTGLFFFVSTVFFKALTFPFECIGYVYSLFFDKKRKRLVDLGISIWAWLSMKALFYQPKIEGLENLPPDEEGVLYLANHSSYLDILTLSAFIPRGFKYVSKAEILNFPIFGWSMQLAGHIPLTREDPRSQLETVKATIKALEDGNSVCMFPEGTRMLDGYLGEFKKGAFVIAKKAKAKIVPISLCRVHKWFPNTALLPLARPTDVILKIHPPIDSKDFTDAELLKKTYEAIEGGMPNTQRRPLPSA